MAFCFISQKFYLTDYVYFDESPKTDYSSSQSSASGKVWKSSLNIDLVEPSDAGWYRCQVGFEISPSSNMRIKLKLVVGWWVYYSKQDIFAKMVTFISVRPTMAKSWSSEQCQSQREVIWNYIVKQSMEILHQAFHGERTRFLLIQLVWIQMPRKFLNQIIYLAKVS